MVEKATKSPECVEIDPDDLGDSDGEDILKAMVLTINNSLEAGKEIEKPVYKNGMYKGQKILCIAEFDVGYLEKC